MGILHSISNLCDLTSYAWTLSPPPSCSTCSSSCFSSKRASRACWPGITVFPRVDQTPPVMPPLSNSKGKSSNSSPFVSG